MVHQSFTEMFPSSALQYLMPQLPTIITFTLLLPMTCFVKAFQHLDLYGLYERNSKISCLFFP